MIASSKVKSYVITSIISCLVTALVCFYFHNQSDEKKDRKVIEKENEIIRQKVRVEVMTDSVTYLQKQRNVMVAIINAQEKYFEQKKINPVIIYEKYRNYSDSLAYELFVQNYGKPNLR